MSALATRFREHLLGLADLSGPGPLLVAVSGGTDSTVLLHLLRFTPGLSTGPLLVAHFDHGMRSGSRGDALWVKGLASAWGLGFELGRAQSAPASEAQARTLRYGFLHDVKERHAARWLLTAHQKDDQAETVLFRVVRGSGLRGVAGIPEMREPRVLRPLLPFWRAELEEYARWAGLRTRADPSNRAATFARNRIRHDLLPALERDVAPGARKALCRLAEHAREAEEALDRLTDQLLLTLVRRRDDDEVVLSRDGLGAADPYLRSRVLRKVAEAFGVSLDSSQTRRLTHAVDARSTRGALTLPGGLQLWRDHDVVTVHRPGNPSADVVATVERPCAGAGPLRLAGRLFQASWSPGHAPDAQWVCGLHLDPSDFPLLLRGFTPGDRMRLDYGTKKLKKLFREAGLPRLERGRRPIVVDRSGGVLWAPGVAQASRTIPSEGAGVFYVGFTEC